MTDFTAMARDAFTEVRGRNAIHAMEYLVDKFASIATLSHAAGRAEGLTEAAKVAKDYEKGSPWHADAIAGRIRALASDPAPRDQVAEDRRREPQGGNFYRPHNAMIDSGTFWRCKHGLTGLGKETDCPDCAADDPAAYRRWHGLSAPAPVDPGLAAQDVERPMTGPESKGPPEPGSFMDGYHQGRHDVLYGIAHGHKWALDLLDTARGESDAALSAPRPAQTKGPTE